MHGFGIAGFSKGKAERIPSPVRDLEDLCME